jgi:hypothetical protein
VGDNLKIAFKDFYKAATDINPHYFVTFSFDSRMVK